MTVRRPHACLNTYTVHVRTHVCSYTACARIVHTNTPHSYTPLSMCTPHFITEHVIMIDIMNPTCKQSSVTHSKPKQLRSHARIRIQYMYKTTRAI